MNCVPVKLKDGSVVLFNMEPGAEPTEADKKVLAEFAQYCREETAARKTKEQRERNRRAK